MKLLGSTISFPFRPTVRGSVAIVSTDEEIIVQAITDLILTRQGERKLLPNYGLPDTIFDILDVSFATRLAFFIQEQIRNYVTAVENVRASAGTFDNGRFISNSFPAIHTAAIRIQYTLRSVAMPQELIYPTWRLIDANSAS